VTVLSTAALAVLLIIAGCGARNDVEPPSAADAERLVADAVRLARAADFEALCDLGGRACQDVLEAAGRDGVPRGRPRIVVNQPMPMAGGRGSGARLFVVCGSSADGTSYRTEMAVVWDDGRATLLEPVFWSRMSVSAAPAERPVGEPSPAAAC
jgi:hypothetical protein